MGNKLRVFFGFFGFWMFMILFKLGGGLHYALNSPLGAKLMPLWAVGMLMALASIIQLVFDIPAGKILDKFGYKRVLTFGTLIFVIATLAFFYELTAVTLIISVVIASFSWLFFGPGKNAYALSHAPKKSPGTFMAFRDIFGSVGITLSCIVLPFIINANYRVISIILSSILFLAFIAMCLSPKDRKKIKIGDYPHERTHHQRKHALNNFFSAIGRLNPASTLLILLNFTGALFYGTVWFVVPLIIANNPGNSELLGIGLGMFDFSIVVIGFLLYNFVDKANKKFLIFMGLLLFSVMGMLLGMSFGLLFLVFAFLTTSGDEIASLPLWAWLHHLDKNHNEDGLISGIINLFEDLGWALGPLVAGVLYTFLGPKLTITISAVPLFILFLIYYLVVRRHIIKISLLDAPRKPHKNRHRN